MKIKIIVILSLIVLCRCVSDPIYYINFFNDENMVIIERNEDIYNRIWEEDIAQYTITSMAHMGFVSKNITKTDIMYNLGMSGYNDKNRLLFLYVNEHEYIISKEIMTEIIFNKAIIDRVVNRYYIKISDLLHYLDINVNTNDKIIFYYKQMRN